MSTNTSGTVRLSDRLAAALDNGEPAVALETTIFSELGLPSPANREALDRVLTALEKRSVVPALSAVLDGVPRMGIDADDHGRICGSARKVAARDLGPAVAARTPYGATTVSATVALAEQAGVKVFATGGIGGVHRMAELTGDISADLPALAKHRVVTVTAGAKVFLDLPRTVEYLETLSVPVIGYRTDEFPAFHAPRSGIEIGLRADSPAEVAGIVEAHWALGGGGVVVANPIPEQDGFDFAELEEAVAVCLHRLGLGPAPGDQPSVDLDRAELQGPAVTPAVLGELAEVTGGRSVSANLALAENNAAVAAEIATALAGRSG